jgi:hypothetical protein
MMTHMQLYYFNLWYVCPRILEALSLLFKFIPEFARYEKYCWVFFRYTRGRVFSNISFHISIVTNIYIYLCSYFFHCKTVLRPYPCHYWSVVAHCKTEFFDIILATTGRWWPIVRQFSTLSLPLLVGGGPL